MKALVIGELCTDKFIYGDTFTASFILNYSKTGNISESIICANKMAAIVVSKRGVATPN